MADMIRPQDVVAHLGLLVSPRLANKALKALHLTALRAAGERQAR